MIEVPELITLPFTESQLDQYFDNIQDYHFNIVYDKQTLSNKKFLNYVYNCNLNFSLFFDSFSDIETLLNDYLIQDNIKSIELLNNIWISILGKYLGLPIGLDEYQQKSIDLFIKNNESFINNIISVLGSLKYFFVKNVLGNNLDSDIKESPVGNNIVSLAQHPYFWTIFHNLQTDEKDYVNYNLFHNMDFDGTSILGVFMNTLNPVSVLYMLGDMYGLSNQADK